MAIDDAVRAARAVFPSTSVMTPDGPRSLVCVMVAVSGAESEWDPRAAGDPRLGGPSCDGSANGHAVAAATSWGLWQIHNVHSDFLRAATGSAEGCAWAEWLYDPVHNAEAALHVLGADAQRGLANWSTWGGPWAPWQAGHGPYRRYLTQAEAALGNGRE